MWKRKENAKCGSEKKEEQRKNSQGNLLWGREEKQRGNSLINRGSEGGKGRRIKGHCFQELG